MWAFIFIFVFFVLMIMVVFLFYTVNPVLNYSLCKTLHADVSFFVGTVKL